MLTIKQKGLLLSINNHYQKIKSKVDKTTKNKFEKNEDLIQIVCFNIMQIGELAKKLDTDFIKTYNKVPWKQIKGMRDKVAHGYDTIDVEKVWETANKDIKELEEYCDWILKNQ